MSFRNHVVVGAGEVGEAVYNVLSPHYDTTMRDLVFEGPQEADVLHICFPYSVSFNQFVDAYIQAYKANLIIVHSTVPVGTCDTLRVVHSPVRGRHPNLTLSIQTFVKYFGGYRAEEAAQLFRDVGIECVVTESARETEAGKLWELAQYGLAIFIEKEIHAYCEHYNLDFDTVYTHFAETYNAGYSAMGEPQVVRPIITHMPGPIGGHCVVPNSRLLNHPLADLVAKAGVNEIVNALE